MGKIYVIMMEEPEGGDALLYEFGFFETKEEAENFRLGLDDLHGFLYHSEDCYTQELERYNKKYYTKIKRLKKIWEK